MQDYICDGTKFEYRGGYIGLPVQLNDLPNELKIEDFSLHRKTEFHVSLLCVKNILAMLPDAEQKILEFFCKFVKEHNVSFGRFTGEFKFAEYEERKTVVALCEVLNLKKFSEALGQKLSIDIPPQPTHITLYTLQPNVGIGLNSPEEMLQKTRDVEVLNIIKEDLSIS